MSENTRLLAAAIRKQQAIKRDKCIDPIDLESRPFAKQEEIFKAASSTPVRAVIAGNQCLAENTLIMTPTGPCPIQELKPGDFVYSEEGKPIEILSVFDNGIKEVADITVRGVSLVSCTAEHRWAVKQYSRENGNLLTELELPACEFSTEMGIKRITVKAPLGNVHEPHAYAIGALLRDGCSRQRGSEIQISAGTEEVPNKVASILGGKAYRKHENNYTWGLSTSVCNYYNEWCKGRYAHEKVVNLEIVKTWDRESLLQFIAGIIDTDRSLYPSRDHITLSIGMQTYSVIEAIKYACLALWQVPLNYTLDNRVKYKHGPIHVVYTRNRHYITTISKELDSYLVSPQKKWREGYETLGGKRTRIDSVTANWGTTPRYIKTYDIQVNSTTNLYMLANGLITHNSGKSTIGGREVSWLLEDKHPYINREKLWGICPITILVLGQVGEQITSNLWEVKIKPFLKPGTFKEVRIGNALQRVEMTNGDRIIFVSHHNCSEARKTVQGYAAHYVWIDEMPTSLSLVAELVTRIISKNGRLLITFTPLLRSMEIKQYIEGLLPPSGQVFKLNMLDNPIFFGRESEILAQYANYPPAEREARLFGNWFIGSNSVYEYDPVSQKVKTPQHYSTQWPHVEAVDPAAASKLGYVLYAKDPITEYWYMIKTTYIDGAAPSDLVQKVQIESAGYHIIRRISDPHESWFIKEAEKMGVYYEGVYKKTERKLELIKNLQQALTSGSLKVCEQCTLFFEEAVACQWSESEVQIINGQKYHVLDAAQYGLDILPLVKITPVKVYPNFVIAHDVRVRELNEKRKAQEKKIRNSKGYRRGALRCVY